MGAAWESDALVPVTVDPSHSDGSAAPVAGWRQRHDAGLASLYSVGPRLAVVSSLWTPEGEHRIPREQPASADERPSEPHGDGLTGDARSARGGEMSAGGEPDFSPEEQEELQRQMAELQERLADTPVEDVVANHAYGLFELAALHLSRQPPALVESRLAIDAFGSLVEGLGERLGEHAGPLRDGLAQIRLAFVQISGAPSGGGDPVS
jgi:hypothetical protein